MSPEVYEFGDVRVDLRRVEVQRSGQPVSLEPKTFDVLRFLIEHRDRLVTKDELLDAVWRDTFVTPNVLTRAVAQLRKALGDDAFEARYIETAAKRGYRFIAPVTVSGSSPATQYGSEESVPQAPPAAAAAPTSTPTWSRSKAMVGLPLVAMMAIGVAIFFAVNSRRHPDTAVQPEGRPAPRRLTSGGGSYGFPAVSPDGQRIAYQSDQSGSMEIYVVGFAPGSKESAVTSDGQQNMEPSWSPDGQWLAYYSRIRGGIWVVPATGGVSRRVADFGSMPAWSPDGERLVFTSYSGALSSQSTLWIVRRDGSGLKELTKLGNPPGGQSQPSWSRDGRLIVFAVGNGGQGTEVWLTSASGGKAARLGEGTLYATPRFSPRDDAIYWAARTPEGSDCLRRVKIDTNGAEIGDPVDLLSFAGASLGGLSIARDGTAVFGLYHSAGNLWAVDVSDEGAVAPPLQLTFDDVRNTAPNVSPDGRRVAFQQQIAGQPITTWLMDEDGKNREPLLPGLPAWIFYPQFGPGGSRLFVTVGGDGPPVFAWVDLGTRQLTRMQGTLWPGPPAVSLSPDGREIAFHLIDANGVMNVWRQSLGSENRKQITFDGEAMSYPDWSKDGKWLAVEIKRGDGTHVGVVSRDGGMVEQITSADGQSWPGSWAPDNDRVAFGGERNGVWNIYAVSKHTKRVAQLTHFTSLDGFARYPSWSPTGRRIVFERAVYQGSLWTFKLP